MADTICYWDSEVKEQRERDATPDEQAEIDLRRLNASSSANLLRMEEIKRELSAIDAKRIRPLAEGDTEYLANLNAQATALRAELDQLKQDTGG